MAQVEARDTSTDTLYLLRMASGQGDRDSREAFLPLAKGEEGIARRATTQMRTWPDGLPKRAPGPRGWRRENRRRTASVTGRAPSPRKIR